MKRKVGLPTVVCCHAAAFFLPHATALANGGGYSVGGVSRTGSVLGFEPRHTERVRMLEERLVIRVGPDQATVDVRYRMRNETKRSVTARFGFPVEETRGGSEYQLSQPLAKAPVDPFGHLKGYQASLGGKPLAASWQAERPAKDRAPRFHSIAGWMVSEAAFQANEELPLHVSFGAGYGGGGWAVSDNGSAEARTFRYRLSSAACWAGTIRRGEIVIEPEGVHPDDIRIIKPVNRFQKDGDRWVWRFEELDPTFDDDLEIEARPEHEFHRGHGIGKERPDRPSHLYADYQIRNGNWSMVHSNYQVRASSTLPPEGNIRYAAENVRERDEINAWSEGAPGPGIGEWLEITPAVPKPLIEILISPGYQKEGIFGLNARPKTIRVTLNDEHTFDAGVPDRPAEFSLPVRGYNKPVRKIRLTFTEIYPGTKYEDLCVTRVLLHAKLDRKPKLDPVR